MPREVTFGRLAGLARTGLLLYFFCADGVGGGVGVP